MNVAGGCTSYEKMPRMVQINRARAPSPAMMEWQLSAAFHKYAYESVRPEEARRAVSKGERYSVLPENTSPYL